MRSTHLRRSLTLILLAFAGCRTVPPGGHPGAASGTTPLVRAACLGEAPADPWAPYFKQQAEDLTLKVGQQGGTDLRVDAKSPMPPGKPATQWYKLEGEDAVALPGATAERLDLRALDAAGITEKTAGFYVCQATYEDEAGPHSSCSRLAEVQVFRDRKDSSTVPQPLLLRGSTNLVTLISGITVSAPPRIGSGGTSGGCPGTYTARASFRDPNGYLTWTPPSDARTCTITDVTANRPAGYASSVQATVGLSSVACAANSASFAVNTASKYSFAIYVNSSVPSNWTGPMLLDVSWQK